MERANRVLDAIESWRSGGANRILTDLSRRLLGDRSAEPARVTREAVSAEPFWREPDQPVVAPRKRRGMWMEQGELWREETEEAHAEHVVAAAPREPQAFESVPASRFSDDLDHLRERAPSGRPETTSSYRARSAGGHQVEIAKFLQVNHAVHGMHGGAELALPRGRFAASFSLWKGNPVGRTPFLMGC